MIDSLDYDEGPEGAVDLLLGLTSVLEQTVDLVEQLSASGSHSPDSFSDDVVDLLLGLVSLKNSVDDLVAVVFREPSNLEQPPSIKGTLLR